MAYSMHAPSVFLNENEKAEMAVYINKWKSKNITSRPDMFSAGGGVRGTYSERRHLTIAGYYNSLLDNEKEPTKITPPEPFKYRNEDFPQLEKEEKSPEVDRVKKMTFKDVSKVLLK